MNFSSSDGNKSKRNPIETSSDDQNSGVEIKEVGIDNNSDSMQRTPGALRNREVTNNSNSHHSSTAPVDGTPKKSSTSAQSSSSSSSSSHPPISEFPGFDASSLVSARAGVATTTAAAGQEGEEGDEDQTNSAVGSRTRWASSFSSTTTSSSSSTTSWKVPILIALLLSTIVVAMLSRVGWSYSSAAATAAASSTLKFGAAAAMTTAYPPVDAPASRYIHSASNTPVGGGGSSSSSSSSSGEELSPSPSSSAILAPSTSPPPPTTTIYTKSRLIPTSYRVLHSYHHDGSAFTQGLLWRKNTLYEGTGLYGGASKIRTVSMAGGTYTKLQEQSLPGAMFGEGITIWPADPEDLIGSNNNRNTIGGGISSSSPPPTVLQLTWREGKVYLWNADTLESKGTVSFSSTVNQGWGLTHDGVSTLFETDGSEYVHLWDPSPLSYTQAGAMVTKELPSPPKLRVIDRVKQRAGLKRPTKFGTSFGLGSPVKDLNELEYIHGWIFANIWYDDRVAIIDPLTGHVVWYLDFSELSAQNTGNGEDCLNGLAYTMRLDTTKSNPTGETGKDVWGGRLWVTGKQWHRIYEIELGTLVDVNELYSPPSAKKKKNAQMQ